MASPGLSPGDKVVDLAALLRASALLAGAASAAVSMWLLVEALLWTVIGAAAGAAGGYALGALIGRGFYGAPQGQVAVVKLGPGAMQAALQAGLIGGLCSGALAVAVPFLFLADARMLVVHLWIGAAAGVFIGVVAAYVATRSEGLI
jgi:uncharacterized membrane protein